MDRSSQIFGCLIFACGIVATFGTGTGSCQRPVLHYFHSSNLPPGTVGSGQLARFAALQGYTQPVEISAPPGTRISVLADDDFDPPQSGPLVAGMQVGSVYQLKVTDIPFHPGRELFPTLEVINRLYPPPGQYLRFPIPIQLTQEELELAMTGRFVTRVVYLEDTQTALGHADEPKRQRYFEVGTDQDPLRVADQLGRPMAILRIGSRIPDLASGETGLGYGHAPLIRYSPEQLESVEANAQHAIERYGRNVPRLPTPEQPTRNRTTLPAGHSAR